MPAPAHLLRSVAYPMFSMVARLITNRWSPYSRLLLVSDSTFWTISWEMRALAHIAQRLGIRVASTRLLRFSQQQAVFCGTHWALWSLLENGEVDASHRLGVAYLHGQPGTGIPEFDQAYQALRQHHQRLWCVQVSHRRMREVVLNSGIAPEKVFLIPIGINLDYFRMQTAHSRLAARVQYGIPQSAVVVGSFQKDGVGWGEGAEPKLIKGPDVFLKTIELLKPRVPELFVLLSGPARGYVKRGLERLGAPYRHCFLKHYPEIGDLYQAVDMYIVASRQEGGPKAVLEAMASGIPLVTTRVGQAMDLVQHGKNGWMVDTEDAEGLAHWTEYAISHRDDLAQVLRVGRQTAEANSYEAQMPLWYSLMKGFVEWEA